MWDQFLAGQALPIEQDLNGFEGDDSKTELDEIIFPFSNYMIHPHHRA